MIFIHSSNVTYRAADSADFDTIKSILSLSDLPTSDINSDKQHFIIAEIKGKIVGCGAIEIYGNYGLFRSFAVLEAFRNLKIGSGVLNHIMELCKKSDLSELFLLTTTASVYFRKAGWGLTDRLGVPAQVAKSSEFAGICPSSAICMNKQLSQQ